MAQKQKVNADEIIKKIAFKPSDFQKINNMFRKGKQYDAHEYILSLIPMAYKKGLREQVANTIMERFEKGLMKAPKKKALAKVIPRKQKPKIRIYGRTKEVINSATKIIKGQHSIGLRYGTKGKWIGGARGVWNHKDIAMVQEAYNQLVKAGKIKGKKIRVDGIYGKNTAAAIKKIQKLVGAKVDGYFGAETMKKLKEWAKKPIRKAVASKVKKTTTPKKRVKSNKAKKQKEKKKKTPRKPLKLSPEKKPDLRGKPPPGL